MDTTIDGVWLPSSHRLVSDVIRKYIENDHYEWHERTVLRRVLRPSDRVLELGTGIGFLAAWCAQRASQVVTLEANTLLIPLIQETFEHNRVNPLFIPLGVSRDGKSQALSKEPDFWGVSATPGSGQPSIRFDTTLRLAQPDVLLMDIEGGEIELAGSPLTGVRALVVEVHGEQAEKKTTRWARDEGFIEVARSADVIGWSR